MATCGWVYARPVPQGTNRAHVETTEKRGDKWVKRENGGRAVRYSEGSSPRARGGGRMFSMS
jgi:ribosomal protein L4